MFLHRVISWLANRLGRKDQIEAMMHFNEVRLPKLFAELKSTMPVAGGIGFEHELSSDGRSCRIKPMLRKVRRRENPGIYTDIQGTTITIHNPHLSDEKILKKCFSNAVDLMAHEYAETFFLKGERIFDPHEKFEIDGSVFFWRRKKPEQKEPEKKKRECTCGHDNGMFDYAYHKGGAYCVLIVLITFPIWYPIYKFSRKEHAKDCKLHKN
jgi:hypothetical protein